MPFIHLLDQFIRFTGPRGESPVDVHPRAASSEQRLRMFQKISCKLIDLIFPFHHEDPEGTSFLHKPRHHL